MISEQIAALIRQNLGHVPTGGQEKLIDRIASFLFGPDDRIFLVRGYAGTGKTTLVASLVKTLAAYRYKTVLLAPTGRAAKVLSSYSGFPAFTIHKKIYRQKKVVEGFGEFGLDRNLSKNTLFIVDEASMISNQSLDLSVFGSGRLLDDLVGYVYSSPGCKLVLIGDDAQLPPVGFDQSDALKLEYLERYGMKVEECSLTDVVRQSVDSGILSNATHLRKVLLQTRDRFDMPGLRTSGFPDFQEVRGDDLLEELERSYGTAGLEETMVVCRSNKLANRYNQGIRNMILKYEEEIRLGDLIMVVKNNYYWLKDSPEIDFIANGDILEVVRAKGSKELYDLTFRDLMVRFTDYRDMEFEAKAMLDTLFADTPSLDKDRMRNFFAAVSTDYQQMKGKKHKADAIREDPFFNALQIKFAYAVTCHKAQGGQWKHVYIDQGYITEDKVDREYFRWLYTAITRATEKVFLVNFRPEFFTSR
ncbi:MAG: ATP-dependent endonuclease [Bacteroidetes bacterium GWF2_49_14]|nr:MAG: ATP-dependent endonuclease [Bacteroidetes bacterium GWF2_49_14]